ncbi:MAG: TatD family hydrolase, partial [Parasporobacterium sp.]|nr:TatD family hydrolase [Parasporobacterium sp.]
MKNKAVIDAHAHLDLVHEDEALNELIFRKNRSICTCLSAGNMDEWVKYRRLTEDFAETTWVSFGIHPWYSRGEDPSKYTDVYRDCIIIGEIGLDTLWTDVPYEQQHRVFTKQLAIAEKFEKPILLHTKNCERDVYELVKG